MFMCYLTNLVTCDILYPAFYVIIHNVKGMSCPSWQWHRTGSSWSPVRTLPVAPLWCDLGFVPNSRGNKAAANLRPKMFVHVIYQIQTFQMQPQAD